MKAKKKNCETTFFLGALFPPSRLNTIFCVCIPKNILLVLVDTVKAEKKKDETERE